jgi:hypothetical protein
MTTKRRTKTTDPYATIRQLTNATHSEVQYFLPYVKAWLANPEDPMLADMNSVTVALLCYAMNGQLFVSGDKTYTH